MSHNMKATQEQINRAIEKNKEVLERLRLHDEGKIKIETKKLLTVLLSTNKTDSL